MYGIVSAPESLTTSEPEMMSREVQVTMEPTAQMITRGVQVNSTANPKQIDLGPTLEKLAQISQELKLPHTISTLSDYVSSSVITLQPSGTHIPKVHDSTCSWNQYYPVLPFLLNGHLHAQYQKLSAMLGLPSCSNTQWHRIIERLEKHTTKLAEWSCEKVREAVKSRGEDKKWTASYDGFYLTKGHYSNNSSATLHDFATGGIAWFTHRTKRGPGHTWEGTSAAAEGDMFAEILKKAKEAGFDIAEIVTDKDSSMNAIIILPAFS